jgi:hypothetical protein
MKLRFSLLFFLLSAAACFVLFTGPSRFRAQTPQAKAAPCCGSQYPVAPREVDFPYYNLSNGWISTLNLVSDSPKPLDFTLAVKGKLGQVLTTSETIQSQAKLAIDLGSLITQLGGDRTGTFAEGSVAVYFTGTIMPLVGQITMRNPALSLAHESVMVEHDPGRSDIPAELDGLWWGLGSREARVMVSNTSTSPQTADVYLDFQGQRHPLPAAVRFLPYETKTLEISQLLASLGVSPAQAPEGGITIIQRGIQPALIANGRTIDAATGFSSTIDFPWAAMQKSNVSALHASGLPIGAPSADSPFAGEGTFIPHVVVRNLIGSPQTVSITLEYPQAQTQNSPASSAAPVATTVADSSHGKLIAAVPVPGDADHHPEWGHGTGTTMGMVTLGPFPVPAYSAVDYTLVSAMAQLPSSLPYCSIRIQYSGVPGSVQAQATSVEAKSNLIVDSHVQSEGNGWAGSGANPWHLDDDTESILFLTNEGEKPVRMGFAVTANDVHYFLTRLRLAPHETRVIDIRQLRDAQVPDYKKNLIPASATDGSVTWNRIDDVAVMGRLMVIHRHAGMASNYDCCTCPCPSTFSQLVITPWSATVGVGDSVQLVATEYWLICNWIVYPWDITDMMGWQSSASNVASVTGGGLVTAQYPGTADVYNGNYYEEVTQYFYDENECPPCIVLAVVDILVGAYVSQIHVDDTAIISGPVNAYDGGSPGFSVTTTGETPTSYAWSFTSPSGAGNSPNVNFNPNNQASTTTDAHWFALPDSACSASLSAVYTIIATVTFPSTTKQPQTTLTVNLWSIAGYTAPTYVLGSPSIGQNPGGTWIVTGQGSLERVVQSPQINFVSTSQFYNKTIQHENKHVQQWTSGMLSDLYVVSNLMSQLSPLTGTTQADLQNQISAAMSTWNINQNSIYLSRKAAAEAEAYQVSDPIAPQYIYQSTCGGNGL